ncbi:MAG: histidine kinase [Ramlibacter sp.]|jgi:two-component system sensor histidine kinase HydH|nr:histidine kinase [Ramlibacter sp.]
MATAPARALAPFNLRRRFALTSLALIVLIALALGELLTRMLTDRMLQREGEVSQDFVRNVLVSENAMGYFSDPRDPVLEWLFVGSMKQLSTTEEPVRANAFDADGRVIWSTDAKLIGRRDVDNDELVDALRGELVVHGGVLRPDGLDKQEHAGLADVTHYFVESYIPIREKGKVVGVIELYKIPVQLSATIREAVLQLWLACAGSGLLLFLALNGVVRNADRVMREQQRQLAESQALASAVELAGAVAHNLRNPLASIRTAAEMLASGSPAEEQAEHREDIMASVDRANRWITELVRVSNAGELPLGPVSPVPLWRDCLQEVQPEMTRQGVLWELQEGNAPPVHGNTAMLRQILLSTLVNAIEAMPQGGPVRIGWEQRDDRLHMTLDDAGPGITEQARQALFRPFFSTKSGGLGIGLALARRTLAQWGGTIDLQPNTGIGSRVTITLRLAAGGA